MRQIIGACLVAMPFLVLFGVNVAQHGIATTLLVWAVSFAVAGSIIAGVWLLTS